MAFKAASGTMAVGSYTGTSGARSITGLGFAPGLVIVAPSASGSNTDPEQRMTSYTSGNNFSFDFDTGGNNQISSLDADGFMVSTGFNNSTGPVTYHYVAWKEVAGSMKQSFYTGDGTDNRNITGVGFEPEYVFIISEDSNAAGIGAMQKMASTGRSTDSSVQFIASGAAANNIQTLQSDGFQVGSGGIVNKAGGFKRFYAAFARSSPTQVALADARADAHPTGVQVTWHTGYEVDTLGYHVYREAAGARVRLTPTLLAGSALLAGPGTVLTAGRGYTWWDPQPAPGARYWLEAIALNGQRTWYGPLTPTAAQTPAALSPSLSLTQVGQSPATPRVTYQPLAGAMSSTTVAPAAVGSPQPGLLAARPAVLPGVRQAGWYQVGQAELVAAGLPPNVDPRQLQLYVHGREIPIQLQGDPNSRFTLPFYGEGLDTPWTDTQVYWLVVGDRPGLRIPTVGGSGQAVGPASFPMVAERQDRTLYVAAIKNGDAENFFGPLVTAQPVAQTLALPHLDANPPGTPQLDGRLQGITAGAHAVQVTLNGVALGEVHLADQASGQERFAVAPALLRAGENTVTLQANGGDTDITAVDVVRLTYWQRYHADGEQLRFSASGGTRVTVDGFGSTAITVLDVTDPEAVYAVAGLGQPPGGSKRTGLRQPVVGDAGSRLGNPAAGKTGAGLGQTWGDGAGIRPVPPPIKSTGVTIMVPGSGQRTLLAVGAGAVQAPAWLRRYQPPSWLAPNMGAALVILTHPSLHDAWQPLQAWRAAQGWQVELVDVNELYAAFSDGVKTPYALRAFLQWARAHWQPRPGFVLLAGDASFDPRNYLGRGDWDLVPTKLVDTTYLETASDDWLGELHGDGASDLAIGRIPVRTPAAAATLVQKLIGYDQGTGPQPTAVIVADKEDGYDFAGASRLAEAALPASLAVTEVFRGRLSDTAAHQALLDQLNAGPSLVTYFGHGSVEVWRGGLFSAADAHALHNGSRLPFVVSLTCLNGLFHDLYTESLAEALLNAEAGGAVAVWASSALTEAGVQVDLLEVLLPQLFGTNGTKARTLGEAVQAAKQMVDTPEVRKTWILFGDPTTRLP